MALGYVTTDNIDVNEIWYNSVVPAMDMYREVSFPVLSALAMPHPYEILKYGISEKNGYQTLSQGERPVRKYVQEAVMTPTVTKYGYGVGTDLDTIRWSTSRQIQMAIDRGFKEDAQNILLQMLKVMMVDPSTNNAGYGFYNGEFATEEGITTPPSYQNNTFAANHDHYYASGNATIRLQDITDAKQTIRHHGHVGTIIAMANSAMQAQLEKLASFTSSSLVQNPVTDAVAIQGFTNSFRLLGVDWYISEMIPDNYFMMVEVSDIENKRPVIMFEPRNMAGLNLMPGPMNDYPFVDSFFERWMGFKVAGRGAGVVVHVTAGAWADPTFNE